MWKRGLSLWNRIPRNIWLETIPIITTALFVSGGAATAELITRVREGKPFGESVSAQAVADLSGVLLLVNFVVVLWFGYRALNEALSKAGPISLTTKLVGITTAVVTSGELFSRAVKSGQPERLVFCLLVLFYIFVVPFFLLRQAAPLGTSPDAVPDEERRAARQAMAALELVVYAVAPCVAAVVAGSLYFAVLNEGIHIMGHAFVAPYFEGWIPPADRIAYWGFNPSFLGIGWLSAILMRAQSRKSLQDVQVVRLDRVGRRLVRLAAYGLAVLLALALISPDSLYPAASTTAWRVLLVKVALGVLILGAFHLAHHTAWWIDRSEWRSLIKVLVQVPTFALIGAGVGAAVLGLRLLLGGTTSAGPILIMLHAGGFALAFAAGRLALSALQRWFTRDVSRVLGSPRPPRD